MRNLFLFSLSVILFFSACKKEEITREVNEDLIIEGNKPPDYSGVSEVQIRNYVNRLYIDLLGVTPSSQQLGSAIDKLKSNLLSKASRLELIQELVDNELYYRRFHEMKQFNLLEGTDSQVIQENILVFEFVKQGLITEEDYVAAQLVQLEIDRMQKLQDALPDLIAGKITINEYYRRFINNFFYDEINMGSENFVISTFENFYNRFPTESELERGVEMVDGVSSSLFFEPGNNKGDFMNITLSTEEFYTGWVYRAFITFLLREPTNPESAHFAEIFRKNKDITEIHSLLLKTDEYAGFK